MWNRVDLKERAKEKIGKNYWPCVAVSFIYLLVTGLILGGSGAARGVMSSITGDISYAIDYFTEQPGVVSGILLGVIGIGIIGIAISMILKIFVVYQLEVGAKGFFIKNMYTNPKIGDILETYNNGSMKTVAITRFLMDLFIGLWTCLFIVPGIIKSYEYSMIPYILADHPDITWREAFELSKQMTNGHKMDLFILDLSFIGWRILAGFTCGLLGVFYVNPYYEQTLAEAYEVLR